MNNLINRPNLNKHTVTMMTLFKLFTTILAIQGVAGVEIHTLPLAATSEPVSNAVSDAVANTVSDLTTTVAESFPGTGRVLGTGSVPETTSAIRDARLRHYSSTSNDGSDTTVTTTNLVTEAANMMQNSADEAVKIATNTLNTCTRSGRGCENGIAVARQTAEQTASRLQNGADWLHSVSENMPSPETIGLVSTAISVHNAVSQGQLEADDICYDDEGISAMLPVVSRSVGTLATGGVSGIAFSTCTTATAPFLGPLSLAAGVGCSYYTQRFGTTAVSGITDHVHGRRRAMNHQDEVREVLRSIVKPSDELFAWQRKSISEAAGKGLLSLSKAKEFWSQMTSEFINARIADLPGDLQAQGRAFVESHKNGEGDNRFMPTPTQVSSLKSRILSRWCLPVNWEEWLELWGTGNVLYHGYEDAVVNDQEKRAEHVVKILKKNFGVDKEVTIVMMDGHLRQWGAILKQMKDEGFNLENVRLRIVDIVDSVNQWHELFLPKSYATIVHSTPEKGGIYAEEVPVNGVLYMNFCGLGRTNEILKTRLKYLKRNGVLKRTIVSMSSRGGQNPETFDWLKKMEGSKEVCKRGKKGMGFHTFAFDVEDPQSAGKKRKVEDISLNTLFLKDL